MERTVKIAVCDDEEKYREDIVRFVAEHCMVRNVAYRIDTFASGRELAAPEGRMAGYDIIYLDINMAEMDGMEAARLLREESTDTYLVFVTAFARFAAEGYRVDATRYVLKDALLKEGICESLDAIFGKMELSESRHEFAFREGIHAVQDKDIVFVESRLHELLFTLQIGSRRRLWHMTAKLDIVEKMLSDSGVPFARIHQSYLVNLQYVKKVEYDQAEMRDGSRLPISRGRYRNVKEQYLLYRGME